MFLFFVLLNSKFEILLRVDRGIEGGGGDSCECVIDIILVIFLIRDELGVLDEKYFIIG